MRRLKEGPSFVRLIVQRGGEVVEVDLAADARLFAVELEGALRVLRPTELAVDNEAGGDRRSLFERKLIDLAAFLGGPQPVPPGSVG